MYRLVKKNIASSTHVLLPISKSIFNRQQIIRAILKQKIASPSEQYPEDCNVILNALRSAEDSINIGHAGSAMRFLTAYYTLQNRTITLRGSVQMHQRPIGILVKALNHLGADIEHIEDYGYPPLLLKKRNLQGGEIEISGSVSSQYITAIMLIAPELTLGLKLTITPPIVSMPYIEMTTTIMKHYGIVIHQKKNTSGSITISIAHQEYQIVDSLEEKDWSAAAFWYEYVSLTKDAVVLLPGLSLKSLQGDNILASVYESLGVITVEDNTGIRLIQKNKTVDAFEYDCSKYPDIALALVCTCVGHKINFKITGLQTLLLKETDRILALKKELAKIGAELITTNDSISCSLIKLHDPTDAFCTYDDHRMAMSLAPLAAIINGVVIKNPEVVNKSYPGYWKEMRRFFEIRSI